MANTYIKIASVTVGAGGAANIEFTSIPATYDDLVVKISARSSSGSSGGTALFDGIRVRPNALDTNFSTRTLYGVPNGTGSNTDPAISAGEASGNLATASTFGNSEVYVPNYAGSTNKSFSADGVSESNATATALVFAASLWSQTTAITSLRFTLESGGNFVQYSTATLYGIKKS